MLASVDCLNEDGCETHSESEPELRVDKYTQAHTLEDFQDFFAMEELEEAQSVMQASVVERVPRAKSNKRTLSELYRPTDILTGLPCKGRARRAKDKIYAFPLFDQCASLPNLPFTFTMLANSGNIDALSKLLYSHLDKNCQISLDCVSPSAVNLKLLLKFAKLMNEINPDSIMCVRGTKVNGQSIKASIYMKFTVNNLIYDVVSRSVEEPALVSLLGTTRSAFVKKMIGSQSVLNEETTKISAVEETENENDLVVYARIEMELLVNDLTKRVSHMSMRHQVSSVEPVKKLSRYN